MRCEVEPGGGGISVYSYTKSNNIFLGKPLMSNAFLKGRAFRMPIDLPYHPTQETFRLTLET
jgi:hypothetical protein